MDIPLLASTQSTAHDTWDHGVPHPQCPVIVAADDEPPRQIRGHRKSLERVSVTVVSGRIAVRGAILSASRLRAPSPHSAIPRINKVLVPLTYPNHRPQ